MSSPALLRVLREIPGPPAALRAVLEGASLEQLATEAMRHGVGAVLLHELSNADLERPGPGVEVLRRQVMAAMSGVLKVKRLLARTNLELTRRGVRPVLLKGYALGARLYGDPLLRPTSDVDLLVAPEEMEASREALASLGLQPKPESDDYYPPAYRHHEAFEGPAGLVELHFRLMANWGSTWEAATVLKRAVSAELEGQQVRYLTPEDELVYLALHAANHMLGRLGWLFDLKLYVRAYPSIDWSRVVAIARATKMPSPAFYAFDAARRLVGAAIPTWVLDALAPTRLAVLAARTVFSEQHLLEAALSEHKGAWAAAKVLLADSPANVTLFAARRLLWNTRKATSGYFV